MLEIFIAKFNYKNSLRKYFFTLKIKIKIFEFVKAVNFYYFQFQSSNLNENSIEILCQQ